MFQSKYKELRCPICFEEFDESFIPLYPCGHYIHQECIAKTENTVCSLCMSDVYIKDLYEKNKNQIKNLKDEIQVNNELLDGWNEYYEKTIYIVKEYIKNQKWYYILLKFLINFVSYTFLLYLIMTIIIDQYPEYRDESHFSHILQDYENKYGRCFNLVDKKNELCFTEGRKMFCFSGNFIVKKAKGLIIKSLLKELKII